MLHDHVRTAAGYKTSYLILGCFIISTNMPVQLPKYRDLVPANGICETHYLIPNPYILNLCIYYVSAQKMKLLYVIRSKNVMITKLKITLKKKQFKNDLWHI